MINNFAHNHFFHPKRNFTFLWRHFFVHLIWMFCFTLQILRQAQHEQPPHGLQKPNTGFQSTTFQTMLNEGKVERRKPLTLLLNSSHRLDGCYYDWNIHIARIHLFLWATSCKWSLSCIQIFIVLTRNKERDLYFQSPSHWCQEVEPWFWSNVSTCRTPESRTTSCWIWYNRFTKQEAEVMKQDLEWNFSLYSNKHICTSCFWKFKTTSTTWICNQCRPCPASKLKPVH